MPVDTEEQLSAAQGSRTTIVNVFPKQTERLSINGQSSHPAVLSRLYYRLINGFPTLRTICVTFAEAGAAAGADQSGPRLQVLNRYCALAEVYVINGNRQSLRNSASQPGQKPN